MELPYNMRVKSIKETRPVETTLPDGLYFGKWGGNIIEVSFRDKKYELETEEGVRGINVNVIVLIKAGIATFDTTSN